MIILGEETIAKVQAKSHSIFRCARPSRSGRRLQGCSSFDTEAGSGRSSGASANGGATAAAPRSSGSPTFYTGGRYDFGRGTDKLENKIRKGEIIPDDHLRAHRIGREEILSAWLPFVGKLIVNYFQNNGKNVRVEKLFQYNFPEQLWLNIRNFLAHLGRLPLWVDYQQSLTIFGARSTASFWEHIFDTGNGQTAVP